MTRKLNFNTNWTCKARTHPMIYKRELVGSNLTKNTCFDVCHRSFTGCKHATIHIVNMRLNIFTGLNIQLISGLNDQ